MCIGPELFGHIRIKSYSRSHTIIMMGHISAVKMSEGSKMALLNLPKVDFPTKNCSPAEGGGCRLVERGSQKVSSFSAYAAEC